MISVGFQDLLEWILSILHYYLIENTARLCVSIVIFTLILSSLHVIRSEQRAIESEEPKETWGKGKKRVNKLNHRKKKLNLEPIASSSYGKNKTLRFM